MKLGKRQSDSIDRILAEGLGEIYSARSAKRSFESKSRLVETLLFEAEMNPDDLQEALVSELSEDTTEAAQKMLTDFDKTLYKVMAPMIEKSGGEKVSAGVLQDDLEDFDPAGVQEVQQELVADLAAALERYASAVALLATHAKLSGVGEYDDASRAARMGEEDYE
jgi:hypothetical protein